MVEFVFNLLVYILNTIIVLLAKVLGLVVSILPDSPFLNFGTSTYAINGIGKYMQYLAWLIPIKNIILIVTAWLGCMLIYYCYSVVMRWIKLID